jgi:hypothetical protein
MIRGCPPKKISNAHTQDGLFVRKIKKDSPQKKRAIGQEQ